MERRELDRDDLERMALPPQLWGVRLDQVPESVRAVVERYLRRAPKMVAMCAGLLINGPGGVGKSAIAALIAKEVRACRMPVYWVAVSDLREAVRKRLMFDEELSVMDKARAVPLLVLDDLDGADAGERVLGARDLERLVLLRGGWRRPTIITTRMSLVEVTAAFGSFVQATQGHMVSLAVTGPSQRRECGELLHRAVYGGGGHGS